MRTYILYHANCFDGTGAAYAAWSKLGDGEHIEYIPVQYGEPLPSIEDGSTVYILDFSYPRDVLEALRSRVNTLVVLDHHKTAAEALEGFPGAVFDMTKSGAILAWEYFHPGEPASRLLQIVQDRDLWQFKLPDTKSVAAALPLLRGKLEAWHKYAWDDQDIADLVARGEVKLRFDELALEAAVKKAQVCCLEMGDARYTVAVSNVTELISETGNRLCAALPVDFSMTFFFSKEGDIIFSFRSIGDFDVSSIAKTFGGGGHKNASGAKLSLQEGITLLQGMLLNAQ